MRKKQSCPKRFVNLCFILFLLFFSIPALSDDWVGFQLSANERILEYHSDGSILCSILNDQRELISLKLIHHDGNILWQYNLPDSFINGSVLFTSFIDESGYAICGKQHSSRQSQALVIDKQGSLITTRKLPNSVLPLAVFDTGILFAAPYNNKTNNQTIYYCDWNGNQVSGTFMGKIIYPQQSIHHGNYACVSVVYEDIEGHRISSLLSFNILDGLINHYDIGSESLWSIQAIEPYCDNALIIVSFENNKHYQMITMLNYTCSPEWNVRVSSTLQSPVAQIITSAPNGNIQIWGTVRTSSNSFNIPYLETTYQLELTSDGIYKFDKLGTYSGTCVKYKNNEVFIVDLDDMHYASLDTFHSDSRSSSPLFTVHYDVQ